MVCMLLDKTCTILDLNSSNKDMNVTVMHVNSNKYIVN